MGRDEAARLLGVPADADPATVRRAYRTWALVAHPDAGGDRQHFAQLTQARRVLLRPTHAEERGSIAPAHGRRVEYRPPPRLPLGDVLQTPAPAQLPPLVIGAFLAIVTAAVPGLAPALGALLAGAVSAGWAALAARAVLRPEADAGHRIAVLALTWLPLAAMQLFASIALGTQLVLALPLLAVPFAGVVAWANAGAGLWRPIGPFNVPRD